MCTSGIIHVIYIYNVHLYLYNREQIPYKNIRVQTKIDEIWQLGINCCRKVGYRVQNIVGD